MYPFFTSPLAPTHVPHRQPLYVMRPVVPPSNKPILHLSNHYHAICEEHGVVFSMRVLKFKHKLAAKERMVNMQKCRRNLTTYQFGQIALRLKPECEERSWKSKIAAKKARAQNDIADDFLLRQTFASTEIAISIVLSNHLHVIRYFHPSS